MNTKTVLETFKYDNNHERYTTLFENKQLKQ